ncbi:MAG: hypothetical protein K2J17_06495, partial [Paramuribaculum sp.]|nr:hypothetical protein [Paramuribaculum sp.]
MRLLTAFRTMALAMVLFVSMPRAFAVGTTTPKAPDFAYPKTVAADAEKRLAQGLSADNDAEILRSLIDLTIAKGLISADNIPAILDQAAAISDKRRGTVAGALVDLLRAQLYDDIYHTDSWTYDERPTVAGPIPTDYKLWSGKQFQNRISELCDSVLLNASLLQSTPITAYPNIIETSTEQRIYFPTLYDFAVYRIIDITNNIDDNLSNVDTVKRLYGAMIDAHPDEDAPRLLAIANLFRFLYPYSSQSGQSVAQTDLNKFKRIYIANSQSPYSGVLLSELFSAWNFLDKEIATSAISEKNMADMLREFIRKHPSYPGVSSLQDNLYKILSPSASVSVPGIVAP